jgi:two-component system, OmpR family, response regulator
VRRNSAHDCLAKPFAMAELIARVRALIRRAHGLAAPEIVLGPLRIDTAARAPWRWPGRRCG